MDCWDREKTLISLKEQFKGIFQQLPPHCKKGGKATFQENSQSELVWTVGLCANLEYYVI